MSASNKRDAQSPASGEGDNVKRRALDERLNLISLDEISDVDSQSDHELDTVSKPLPKGEDEEKAIPLGEKVDLLIGRMDKFIDCFASMQKTTAKTQKRNDKKFKRLEEAHNVLVNRVGDSAKATYSRLEDLESRITINEDENRELRAKLSNLEEKQEDVAMEQQRVSKENTKKINQLIIDQGFTQKTMLDYGSEIKERKIIISGVYEPTNENVCATALNCINNVIKAAIANLAPNEDPNGLKVLSSTDIDNVFRIGKVPRGNRKRNMSVSFMRMDDKDMVLRARAATKDNPEIKCYMSDDLTTDGRAHKAQIKRIATVAKTQGFESKVTGNKVTIDNKTYYSNEFSLIPNQITMELKQEREIDGGIIYRGDKSILSNFFPAPFIVDGIDYISAEQYYQHAKAIHHNKLQTADRIMQLSNPFRIKVLGDGIESNSSWLSKRMSVLYDATRAKFEQNWPLQDQLLLTKGKYLYEATTDLYFGCGLGFESTKWNEKNWPGENVAGLIVSKDSLQSFWNTMAKIVIIP